MRPLLPLKSDAFRPASDSRYSADAFSVRGASLAGETAEKMKIGIIGSGRVGGTVGELWVKAGHEVMFSSLDLEHDKALAARLGAGARAGSSKEAAAFGGVVSPTICEKLFIPHAVETPESSPGIEAA